MGKNRKSIKTTHYEIFNYWKDKYITKDGTIADEKDADLLNSIPVVVDCGEPECFACGQWTGVEAENDDLQECWNNPKVKQNLQRAHIVPDALSGEDKPQNLFCLCKNCHHDAPDTIYTKEFFKFIYRRRKQGSLPYRSFYNAIQACIEQNIPPEFIDVSQVTENLLAVANTHGGEMIESSLVAVLVGSAEERYNKENA